MSDKKNKTRAVKTKAFGILNAYGDFWTTRTFHTAGEAESYMQLFWGNMKNPPDMSKHEVVPVSVTYRPKKKLQ